MPAQGWCTKPRGYLAEVRLVVWLAFCNLLFILPVHDSKESTRLDSEPSCLCPMALTVVLPEDVSSMAID